MIRRVLTVLGVATLLTVLTAVAPVQVSAAPVSTISVANGWEYVPAAQNALDQAREKALTARGIKAETLFGCPDDYICLYHWIEYGGGRWQAHPNNLDGACWNLQNSTYTDGYNVNNTSGSLIANRDGGIRTWLGMYDWVNCNAGGQVWAFDATYWVLKHDLGALVPNAWHKFTSLRVDYIS